MQGIAAVMLGSQQIRRHCCQIALAKDSPGTFLIYNSSLCPKVRQLCGFPLDVAMAYGLGAKTRCSWVKQKDPSLGF